LTVLGRWSLFFHAAHTPAPSAIDCSSTFTYPRYIHFFSPDGILEGRNNGLCITHTLARSTPTTPQHHGHDRTSASLDAVTPFELEQEPVLDHHISLIQMLYPIPCLHASAAAAPKQQIQVAHGYYYPIHARNPPLHRFVPPVATQSPDADTSPRIIGTMNCFHTNSTLFFSLLSLTILGCCLWIECILLISLLSLHH